MYDRIKKITTILKKNPYPGRGIIVGTSKNGKYAVFAYFIMGRSENSRNRVFLKTIDGIKIVPYDTSKVQDPTLIVYSPVRKYGNQYIVTNGDQTDTIYDYLEQGKSFEEALKTRTFEPDEPNYTPRISALLDINDEFTYKISILKHFDRLKKVCSRYTFNYEALPGCGHFIHTYVGEGNPLPSFVGEPIKIEIENQIEKFTKNLWESLNFENKISLYVSYIDLKTYQEENKIINKY